MMAAFVAPFRPWGPRGTACHAGGTHLCRSGGLPMWVRALTVTALACTGPAWAGAPGGLAPPVKLQEGGKPINVDVGHAAPCVADFAGDGTLHLLVGQFGGGKLRVYRNTGTKEKPRFGDFTLLHDGKPEGCVPSG